jgi:glycosyltransferase involved in cell wall biosynthesis
VEKPVNPRVSVVMPCLNEEGTVGLCIEKALRSFAGLGIAGEVIVADNGSTDRSVEIATRMGARVVVQEVRGYGAALSKGISAARGEVIVMGDADDSYDWSAVGQFVRKIDEGYDLVMGNRFKGGIAPGAMPPLHRYLGNPVLSAISRVAFRVPIRDFHCGMRAFTRTAFERMRTRTAGMEFATEMIANAAYQGLRICEIPTTLQPDKRDRAPHLRSFRDGWRHLRFILMYAPDHLYFAPGLSMLGLGMLLMALLARGPVNIGGLHLGIHFVALGSMLALVGFNTLNLGVLAKAILARRYSGLRSRVATWLRTRFRLEYGLILGSALFAVGACVDAGIFVEWLASNRGTMDQTIHLAFAATTMIVLGLNVVFSSFLLAMLLASDVSID